MKEYWMIEDVGYARWVGVLCKKLAWVDSIDAVRFESEKSAKDMLSFLLTLKSIPNIAPALKGAMITDHLDIVNK